MQCEHTQQHDLSNVGIKNLLIFYFFVNMHRQFNVLRNSFKVNPLSAKVKVSPLPARYTVRVATRKIFLANSTIGVNISSPRPSCTLLKRNKNQIYCKSITQLNLPK